MTLKGIIKLEKIKRALGGEERNMAWQVAIVDISVEELDPNHQVTRVKGEIE